MKSRDLRKTIDRTGFAVEVDWLIDEERVDTDFQLLAKMDFVVFKTVVEISSDLPKSYLYRIKTDLAAAWMFLTADTL